MTTAISILLDAIKRTNIINSHHFQGFRSANSNNREKAWRRLNYIRLSKNASSNEIYQSQAERRCGRATTSTTTRTDPGNREVAAATINS